MRAFILASAALLAAGSAQADTRTYQVECVQNKNRAGLVGGILGTAAGVALGRGVAERGVRTEGGLLGGFVGGLVGAGIGRTQVVCPPGYRARVVGETTQAGHGPAAPIDYGAAWYQPSRYSYYATSSVEAFAPPPQFVAPPAAPQFAPPAHGHGYAPPIPTAPAAVCGWGQRVLTTPGGQETRDAVWMCRGADGQFRPSPAR